VKVEKAIQSASEFAFGHSAGHYIKLETSDDDYTIAANDGSLVSMFEIQGTLNLVGADEHNRIVDMEAEALKNRFADSGHALQVVFSYDPDSIWEEVTSRLQPTRVTAQNLGLDMDQVLVDWGKNVARWCVMEKIWVVLWTKPDVLPPSEKRRAKKDMEKSMRSGPYGADCQNVGQIMERLRNEHLNFIESVSQAYSRAGIQTRKIERHEMLWWVRRCIDPEWTSRDWTPLLPGDPLPQKLPDPGREKDVSDIIYPTLKSQLWPRDAHVLDGTNLQVGDRIHSPVVMSLPPQTPRPFNGLFKALLSKRIPWRISFLITGEGLSITNWKRIFTSILNYGANNKMFNKAVKEMEAYELDGGCPVGLRIAASTWVNAHTERPKETLATRRSELASAIQSWGTSDTREVVGDPHLGMSATVPGLMPTSPATVAAAPIGDALHMLPQSRPTLPWAKGSILLRSPDGKTLPYHPMSSEQQAWVDLGVAPMGGGKSVWLNTLNLGYVLQPGLTRLPWLSIIDVGLSSQGLISLLKAALPRDQQHLAEFYRLRMDSDHSINPFDLPLGFQYPTQQHFQFLVNFISLLCTPLDRTSPPEGVVGIARQTIHMTYEELSQSKKPKKYNSLVDPELHETVQAIGMHLDKATSWYEVRDELFRNGYISLAERAQRRAVPLLADVATKARDDAVRRMYTSNVGGEQITDYFWRCCSESIDAYPILKSPTQFNVGAAKVVSLDLDEVAPRGGPQADRQSGVMYMLARHAVGSHMFLMPEDVPQADQLYKEHLDTKTKEIQQDPKRICFDEVHRVMNNQSVADQLTRDLETSIRESRKWSLSIGLYTQSLADIPSVITDELATSIFILGGGSPKAVDEMAERLGLNRSARNAILNITKPDKRGANMLAMFKTAKGTVTQLVTNSLGLQALWAFSTTTEDRAVRDTLYQKFGDTQRVLATLAELYPGGVKPEVERRRQEAEVKGYDEDSEDVVDQLIQETAEKLR
jgi:intracellular multiplication protein IcmB